MGITYSDYSTLVIVDSGLVEGFLQLAGFQPLHEISGGADLLATDVELGVVSAASELVDCAGDLVEGRCVDLDGLEGDSVVLEPTLQIFASWAVS